MLSIVDNIITPPCPGLLTPVHKTAGQVVARKEVISAGIKEQGPVGVFSHIIQLIILALVQH